MPDDELGPLEMRVLGLLDPRAPLSVADVRARLSAGGNDLAYTTVMTVLVRLRAKGLVDRVKDGQRFLYVPARKATSVAAGIVARIQQKLFASDRATPILALLDDAELSAAELKALRRVIDAKLRGKK